MSSIEVVLNFLPCGFIGICGLLTKRMDASVNVGIVIFVVISNGVYYLNRGLGGGRIV